MLLFMFCMWCFTVEVVPPTTGWQAIAYFVTWPEHLGRWVKENFSKTNTQSTLK